MKQVIAATPAALLIVALLGCSQHQAAAPTAAQPDNTAGTAASSDVNTFGDSKEQAAADAEHARDKNYGANKDATGADTTPGSSATNTTETPPPETPK